MNFCVCLTMQTTYFRKQNEGCSATWNLCEDKNCYSEFYILHILIPLHFFASSLSLIFYYPQSLATCLQLFAVFQLPMTQVEGYKNFPQSHPVSVKDNCHLKGEALA